MHQSTDVDSLPTFFLSWAIAHFLWSTIKIDAIKQVQNYYLAMEIMVHMQFHFWDLHREHNIINVIDHLTDQVLNQL